MRVVLDTNVVVSGLLWDGIPRQLLRAAHAKQLGLFTSTVLLLELTDILARNKFERKLAAAQMTINQLVARYSELATTVRPAIIAPIVTRDPDDDHVLACALAAHANLIVSGDRHLLDLAQYEGIRIIKAAEVISMLSP